MYRARFLFSWLSKPQRTYPYEFGRTRSVITDNNPQKRLFIVDGFGAQTFEGFALAYRNIIEALHEQDTGYLKENLEANLLSGMDVPKTQLVNANAPIKCAVHDVGLVMGVNFDRKSTPGYGSLKMNEMTPDQGFPKARFYMALPSFGSGFSLPSISPLLWTTIEITSAYKLVKEGTAVNDTEQKHLFQFEVVPKTIDSNFMGALEKLKGLASSGLKGTTKSFIQGFFGNDYSWKIADIDEHLKGNPWS